MPNLNREGFWCSPEEPDLPSPTPDTSWSGRDRFLRNLWIVKQNAVKKTYRGFSRCRLCGTHNGSQEFIHAGWTWPSGYSHYVVDHNVRPSLAFEEMINREGEKS